MKKTICLILVFTICFSLCACSGANSEANNWAEILYEETNTAYEITDQLSCNIYEAWKLSISDDEKISVSYLASELNLDAEAIDEGVVYAIFTLATDADYDTASESDKEMFRGQGEYFFKLMENDLNTACVLVTIGAYKSNGKLDQAEAALNTAYNQLQELSTNYSDYKHLDALKGYYTATDSYLNFCINPSCTLAQFVDKVDAYRSDAQVYMSELDS